MNMIINTLFVTQCTLFVNQMTQNTLLRHLWRRLKNYNICAWRTWSYVSSRWENIKRNVEPWVLLEKIFEVCTRLCLLEKGLPGTTNAGLLEEPLESENLFEQFSIYSLPSSPWSSWERKFFHKHEKSRTSMSYRDIDIDINNQLN